MNNMLQHIFNPNTAGNFFFDHKVEASYVVFRYHFYCDYLKAVKFRGRPYGFMEYKHRLYSGYREPYPGLRVVEYNIND